MKSGALNSLSGGFLERAGLRSWPEGRKAPEHLRYVGVVVEHNDGARVTGPESESALVARLRELRRKDTSRAAWGVGDPFDPECFASGWVRLETVENRPVHRVAQLVYLPRRCSVVRFPGSDVEDVVGQPPKWASKETPADWNRAWARAALASDWVERTTIDAVEEPARTLLRERYPGRHLRVLWRVPTLDLRMRWLDLTRMRDEGRRDYLELSMVEVLTLGKLLA